MKLAIALAVLAFAATASAAVVIGTPPYNPCPQGFVLSNGPQPARDASRFAPNLFHYNKNELMGGSPVGPWFDIDPAVPCTWQPQGAFNCKLRVYANAARSILYGSATLSSPSFSLVNDAYNSSGGLVNIVQDVDDIVAASFPATPEYQNFRDFTAQVYFKPEPVYPSPPESPIANRLEVIEGQQYLTLWGSSGYNAGTGQYEQAGQGTGVDFRFPINCPSDPPVIPGCPCDDPAALYSVNSGCIQYGVPISRTGRFCVQLSFANAPCVV